MFCAYFHKQFKKDIKNCKKQGKDLKKIKYIIHKILAGKSIDKKYRLHKLSGIYKDRYECHIQPDWLLIF
jgi:mRNA interferase YafQ